MGISGNDNADKLANEATNLNHINHIPPAYSQMPKHIKDKITGNENGIKTKGLMTCRDNKSK